MGEWPWEAQSAAEGPDQAECPESGPPAPGREGVGVRPGRSSSDDLWASSQGAAVRVGKAERDDEGRFVPKEEGAGLAGLFPHPLVRSPTQQPAGPRGRSLGGGAVLLSPQSLWGPVRCGLLSPPSELQVL